MKKFSFSIEAVISMHIDVQAETLEEAVEKAQNSPVQGLCYQCARGEKDCWNTSGELDCDPTFSAPVFVTVDDEEDETALGQAQELW